MDRHTTSELTEPASQSIGAADPSVSDAAAPAPEAALAALERLSVGRTPDVRADDPWAEAGRRVLRFHRARMLVRVPGVIAGEDPEEATRCGSPVARRPGRDGAARDRRDRARTRRRTRARPRASGGRYEACADTEGLAAVPAAPHEPSLVRNRMPSRAWAAYEAVWASDDGLHDADLATLHQLRIAGKWLRYTLEFVREPLQPEATRLIRRVVALQDHIGVLHDMHVAATLAGDVLAGSVGLTTPETKAIERFVRHLDDGTVRLRRTLGSPGARSSRPTTAGASAALSRAPGRASQPGSDMRRSTVVTTQAHWPCVAR